MHGMTHIPDEHGKVETKGGGHERDKVLHPPRRQPEGTPQIAASGVPVGHAYL